MPVQPSASAKAKAIFIAACATFAMGGAVAGSNIGTTPITRAEDPLGTLPRHDMAAVSPDAARAMEGPRDHYDVDTPGGRIPAEELVWHGRMRDTRLAREYLAADYSVDDATYEELDYETYISSTSSGANEPAGIEPDEIEPNASARPELTANTAAPAARPNPPAPAQAESARAEATQAEPRQAGGARHIDVTATLANRAS